MSANSTTLLLSLVCVFQLPAIKAQTDIATLLEMDLEALSQVTLFSTAALTETERRKTPATTTVITRDMIDHSGARSLDELFMIFVPSFQSPVNLIWGHTPRVRGNNSGAEKLLLLLNGRVMNSNHAFGPITERNLSMLGDIESIEFVRGPGSAIYGSGAIFGVINIKTYNSADSRVEGFSLDLKRGFVEDFTSAELR